MLFYRLLKAPGWRSLFSRKRSSNCPERHFGPSSSSWCCCPWVSAPRWAYLRACSALFLILKFSNVFAKNTLQVTINLWYIYRIKHKFCIFWRCRMYNLLLRRINIHNRSWWILAENVWLLCWNDWSGCGCVDGNDLSGVYLRPWEIHSRHLRHDWLSTRYFLAGHMAVPRTSHYGCYSDFVNCVYGHQ